MNKKILTTLFILLLIPIFVTIIVYYNNRRVQYTEYRNVVNYSEPNKIVKAPINPIEKKYGSYVIVPYNRNYIYIIFSSLIFLGIFFILFFYLTRKKEW